MYNLSNVINCLLFRSMLTDLFPVSKRDKFAFSSLLGLEDRMKTAQSILVQYMSLQGSTPHDAKVTFVKYAQQAPLYGCSWYVVNQLLFKELPSVLLLAISAKGVMLVDPNGMVITCSYWACVRCSCSPNCVSAGNPETFPVRPCRNLGAYTRSIHSCRW